MWRSPLVHSWAYHRIKAPSKAMGSLSSFLEAASDQALTHPYLTYYLVIKSTLVLKLVYFI